MELSNYDLKMFEAAKLEAEKSDYKPFKLGCVITYKGHIIGHGHNSNKTNPLQKKYNMRYRKFNSCNTKPIRHSIHAELSALLSVPYAVGKDMDWNKASIYIYRISNGNKPYGYGCAKPCNACAHAIRDFGIKNIYYTDSMGLAYLRLD